MAKRLQRIQPTSEDVRQLQDNVERVINPVLTVPLNDGLLITNVEVFSGIGVEVPHRLQRVPVGWFLVSPNADVRVWEDQENNPSRSRILLLRASADAVASIFVF